MVTVAELQQAERIVFRIQVGGESIRTDPRSTVGRLVNRALQRTIDLQQALRDAQARITLTPTEREEILLQSLPAGVRELPLQSFPIPITPRQPTTLVQQLRPREPLPITRQVVEDFGDVALQTRLPIVEPPRARPTLRDFFAQEVRIPFIAGVPGGEISLREIRRGFAEAEQLPLRVVAQAIPATRGEVAFLGGITGLAILAPPIIGTGIGLGIAGLQLPRAFDPELLPEERIAGGIFGGLGAAGAAAGVTPFVRGIGARGTRIAPEGFQVIPGVRGVGDIGLIQPGKGARISIDLPPTSPLVRGGFGRRPGGEAIFLGEEQLLATSQRGFFEIGREIPIEREFFVTPQEPTLGIAETRISRLGLQDPFKFPESVEIGFGIPPRPQIGITIGEVARTERAGAFAIGRGTELEAIRTTGVVREIQQIGRTRIGGQGVDIFEFQIGRVPTRRRPSRPAEDFISTEFTTRVPGEPLLGTLGIRPTRGISTVTASLVSPLLTAPLSPEISIPISPRISPPTTPIISPLISPEISPPIFPEISPPISPTVAPEIFPLFGDPLRSLRLPIRRRKKKEKKVAKRKRIITPIRPSFTGIVLGIEEAARITPGFGVLPGEIRGLATGFEVPKRKKTKKTKKKKVSKKKSKKKKK